MKHPKCPHCGGCLEHSRCRIIKVGGCRKDAYQKGDRVIVAGEGPGTVVDCRCEAIGVRIHADGVVVDAAHGQTREG